MKTSKPIRQLTLRVKKLDAQIATMRGSVICAFNQLLDLKDLNTGFHSTRLAEWGVRVARELDGGAAWLKDVEIAALLHDIGKVGVPDAILKTPNRLTDDEWALMKKHPEYGWAGWCGCFPTSSAPACSSSTITNGSTGAGIRRV